MKKLFLVAPLALAAAGLLAAPASAAPWHNAGQVRAEINQLDRQVDRVRGLSPREERRLEGQVDRLKSLYSRSARNGFTRGEISLLNTRIAMVRNQLFKQANDFDRRDERHGWRDRR